MTLLNKFYGSLYGEENCSDIDEYLSHINLPALSTAEAKLRDLEINENEYWLTLNKIDKSKASIDLIVFRPILNDIFGVNLSSWFRPVLHIRFLLREISQRNVKVLLR